MRAGDNARRKRHVLRWLSARESLVAPNGARRFSRDAGPWAEQPVRAPPQRPPGASSLADRRPSAAYRGDRTARAPPGMAGRGAQVAARWTRTSFPDGPPPHAMTPAAGQALAPQARTIGRPLWAQRGRPRSAQRHISHTVCLSRDVLMAAAPIPRKRHMGPAHKGQ